MTGTPSSGEYDSGETGTIELTQDEREAMARLAGEFASEFERTQSASLQRRFGGSGSGIRGLAAIIRMDPDRPGFVQICTEVHMGEDVACWCEPPGTCERGPCESTSDIIL
jgi:hypothetical protein